MPSSNTSSRWLVLLVGLIVVASDVWVFRFFIDHGNALSFALIAAWFSTLGLGVALVALVDSRARTLSALQGQVLALLAALLLCLRGGLLGALLKIVGAGETAAILATTSAATPVGPMTLCMTVVSLISSVALYAGYRWLIDARGLAAKSTAERWDLFYLSLAAAAVLLRLCYLGQPELIFEEAYYWNYAQHLDYGYLDHPPMVAWLIRLFIGLFGNGEFAVRSGAFLCWLVTAGFVTRLTHELFGRAVAYRALALVALLPAYFFFGFFMSPDAPVTACWAAAIYFMHRALIADKPNAWFGVGIALGLGMTSKYTIALVGVAFVLFVLFDRQARQWLRRPQPYLVLLIALLLFSPPVIWNWQHDWISFAFQSEGRVKSGFSFSLPRLIGNVLVFLTPTGLLAVVALLLQRQRIDWPVLASPAASLSPDQQARSRVLLIWLAIFPLAVFTAASLTRVSKLNWTGPLWLALLPLLACLMPGGMAKADAPVVTLPKLAAWCRRAWPPTLVICLLLYGGALHWLSLGLPGVGYPDNLHLLGWRDFGRDVEQRVQYLERQRGEPVLVVGLDRNRIASGLAFYRTLYLETAGQPHVDVTSMPAFTTASQNLFGDVGLMYRLWFPNDAQTGKTLLLVAEKVAELNAPRVLERVRTAGEIQEVRIWKQDKPAGRYYLRLVTGYHDRADDNQAGAGDAADD